MAPLAWGRMASFFIDTDTGQIATLRQLNEAGLIPRNTGKPALPWFPIQGTSDATTLWYAVMRKPVRDKYIGALCIRHSDHHASLMQKGWQEVAVDEISATTPLGSKLPGLAPRRCTPAS